MTAVRRTGELAREHQTARWRLVVSRVASSRPVALPIALIAIGLLAFAASHVRSTKLGLSLVSALPAGSEVRRADDAATRGFAPGIVSPTEIDLLAPGIAGRRAQLARLQDSSGASPASPPSSARASSRRRRRRRSAVRATAAARASPSSSTATRWAPRRSITCARCATACPACCAAPGCSGTRVAYGGQTALADDTVSRVLDDLARVAVVAILVNLLLLALFMRALVAPLYLVASSILGLLASLGLTTLFFQVVLGHDDLTYYVPFAAAVLLVALGSDYNVFVAGRIWDEARRMRLREAIAVAAPQAARAVTVAGLALAASFALLAIVPLRSFREFAFVMGVGVLVDTFIVRTLLVPALTSLFGERAWWPGRRVRRLSKREFLDLVGGRAGLPRSGAQRATDAALVTLSERITPRETHVLAAQLPRDLRAYRCVADPAPPSASAPMSSCAAWASARASTTARPRRTRAPCCARSTRRWPATSTTSGPSCRPTTPPCSTGIERPLSPRASPCANMRGERCP